MAKVQDYGKDTGIQIDSVLYFKAEHKYVDVTYWVAEEKRYATKTIQWALKAILAAHPEFEQVHRSTLARRDAIIALTPTSFAIVDTKNETYLKLLEHVKI